MLFFPFILVLSAAQSLATTQPSILVVGSANADIIVPLERHPRVGETVLALNTPECGRTMAGGKGANQAVSCSRLGVKTLFAGRLGDDANGLVLRDSLLTNKVDISLTQSSLRPTGMGLVFVHEGGAASCVVIGGANSDWTPSDFSVEALFADDNIACVMLQMEVPDWVNERVATEAYRRGVPVFQDVGGEARDLSSSHLKHCTYLSPNLSELQRLTGLTSLLSEEEVISAARQLQAGGVRNVLVTLGAEGSLLLSEDGEIIRQNCCPVDEVVDETGAGDCFRAAFVVAHFAEKKGLKESMEFAAASGAVSVTRVGAIASCATRTEVESLVLRLRGGEGEGGETTVSRNNLNLKSKAVSFPLKFASRLNSMKERLDLWKGADGVLGYIARQGLIEGLDLVDFNYPQHLHGHPNDDNDLKNIWEALNASGLACGAICLRFPKDMQLGAFTHPDLAQRQRAIQLTKNACEWALALGTNEVVVWSAFDGYDYALQVDYDELWSLEIAAFQEVCDAYPDVKVSLEFKPTDENTRFFTVPSTGAAVLLVKEVDRDNFGLTLDFGHCLLAGENPAQSVAMVCRCAGRNKLFGFHFNSF